MSITIQKSFNMINLPFSVLKKEMVKNETPNVTLIWSPLTNNMPIDQSKMAVLWQSWDHTRAWDVKGEGPRKCCSNNVNEQDWWSTPREQGCCYILSFSYLFLVIISHWARSGLTQIWAIVPSVSLYGHLMRFYTSGEDLVLVKSRTHKRENICTGILYFFICKVLHRLCSRRPHITFQNLKALNPFHTFAHLASYPSSVTLRIPPATWLNSAALGHGGPTMPLSSPDALTGHTCRGWGCPADQRLNFILNGMQHPASMKWSLIIKLKSLSAEQFKWR